MTQRTCVNKISISIIEQSDIVTKFTWDVHTLGTNKMYIQIEFVINSDYKYKTCVRIIRSEDALYMCHKSWNGMKIIFLNQCTGNILRVRFLVVGTFKEASFNLLDATDVFFQNLHLILV